MIGIGQNVEHVAKHGQEELLEEGIRDGRILLGKVAHKLDGNYTIYDVSRNDKTSYRLYSRLRPISAMSRMVCLMAQMIESISSLNCGAGSSSKAIGKELLALVFLYEIVME